MKVLLYKSLLKCKANKNTEPKIQNGKSIINWQNKKFTETPWHHMNGK